MLTTYDEAMRWLREVGGTITGPTAAADDYSEVVAEAQGIQRRVLLDGQDRSAVNEAIVEACNDLRSSLE